MDSQSPADQGTASIDDIERYEVIGGVRLEREPMGAFETMLAPWLCHLLNSFPGTKIGFGGQPSPVRLQCLSRPETSSRRSLCVLWTLVLSRYGVRTCLESHAGFGGRNCESRQFR